MEATSIDGLVAHCESGRFTGILRVRAHEGMGEVWFLSGVADEVHFGVSAADEALGRMRTATEVTYELVPRLPHPAGGFKRRFPAKGSIAAATPVTLMRYCEQYALTCTLAVESGDVLVEAKYELGELVSVETTADDDGITAMLEADKGTYEFTLPRVELPAGTPVLPPAPALAESIPPPESLGFRALLENKPVAGRAPSDEAAVKRKTVAVARQQKAATPRAAVGVSAPKPAAAPDVEASGGAKKAGAATAPKDTAPAKSSPRAAASPSAGEKRAGESAAAPEPSPAPKEAAPAKSPPRPAAGPRAEEKRAADSAGAPEPSPAPKEATPTTEADTRAEEKRPDASDAPIAPATASKESTGQEAPPTPDESEPDGPEPTAAAPHNERAVQPRSRSWLVAVLLFAAALGYLAWTHR